MKEYLNVTWIRKYVMKKKSNHKRRDSPLWKAWYFIWYDDSLLSWLVNVLLAFLIVKFIFYPGLSFLVGSPLPLVAVTSPSMEHRASLDNSFPRMCGEIVDETGFYRLSSWWDVCGSWYEENTNISLSDFEDFPLRNGFNKGDIIFLRGASNIDIGDIIVFQTGKEHPIIHRVVSLESDRIVTKGDNNPGLIIDSELDETNVQNYPVLGKAYAKIPYLGYVKIWFTDFVNWLGNVFR